MVACETGADPVCLYYREAIIAVVAEILRGMQFQDEAAVRAMAVTLASRDDGERVVALALYDLRNLFEGNVSRYRLLHPQQFRRYLTFMANPL